MWQKASSLLVVVLLAGCVTVTDEHKRADFDNIQAAESRVILGLEYLASGQWQRAHENIEMAIQYAPRYYRARIAMAHYLQRVGEVDKAEVHYIEALRYSPTNGDVLNNYGVLLCRQERYDEAQSKFAKAIDQPYYYQLSASYENAGLCALKAGDEAFAKQQFEKAVSYEPNRPRSTLQLAKLEYQDQQFGDARLRLFQFHKRYGYKPQSLYMLVRLEKAEGRESEALRYGQLLASQYPKSREYRLYLANDD